MRHSGIVVENRKFTDGSGGMVIYKTESLEDCEALVKTDPYVVEGARTYQILEREAVWIENTK